MEQLNFINPNQALCVSGHRPERLPGGGDPDAPQAQPLIAALRKELIAAVERGKTTVLHGCMAGFDIFAMEQVIILKQQYPQLKIISVAPYSAHFFSRENCWTPDWISRAKAVFRKHDFGVKVAGQYRPGIYYERNRILVDHSGELICYHDGGRGGTAYTVEYAEKSGLSVCNLYNRI